MTHATSAVLPLGDSWDAAMAAPCESQLPDAQPQAGNALASCCEQLLRATAENWRSKSATRPAVSGSVRFTIPGTPIAKGRPRFVRATGRTFTPEKTARFENLVRLVAAETMSECAQDLFDGAVSVEIVALFPIAQSWSRIKREQAACGLLSHTSRPDSDNIAKAITDSCNGIVWHDDSQIARLTVEKRYATEPCTVVWVRSLP